MHAQKQDEYSHGCTSGTHLVITALYLSLVDHKQYQHTYNLYHDSYQNAAATEVFLKIVPTGMPPPNEVCTKVIGFIMTAPPPPPAHTHPSLFFPDLLVLQISSKNWVGHTTHGQWLTLGASEPIVMWGFRADLRAKRMICRLANRNSRTNTCHRKKEEG